MMSERLRAVIAQAEQLSDQEQEALAAAWEEILEEREWERIVAKPTVRDALRRMAAEARDQDAAGETEEISGDSFV
ncbi:MAG TPA: hypothetical protein VIC85_06300 [Ktedonobacterales bacterium]